MLEELYEIKYWQQGKIEKISQYLQKSPFEYTFSSAVSYWCLLSDI